MIANGEFNFIARHFHPLAGEGSLDLRDDAALIPARPGFELVVSTDTIVENVHFLSDDPAETVSRKLLRVNLSDCAAMGATPFGYFMNVCRPPDRDDRWFESFAAGLAEDQQLFGIHLLGGDTTGIKGPLVLGVTILAWTVAGKAIRRTTAKPGDDVWVTGTIGDAALGLLARRGELPDPDGFLGSRYQLPQPRLGVATAPIVHAGMDISDGLLQDCGHLANESQVNIIIESPLIPLSKQVKAAGADYWPLCLTGGDDYELLLTAPPQNTDALRQQAAAAGTDITRIGRVTAGTGEVQLLDANGEAIELAQRGWQHF